MLCTFMQNKPNVVNKLSVRVKLTFLLHSQSAFNSQHLHYLRWMAQLGFFPATLCCGRDSNPHQISRVAPTQDLFEGRSTD